MIITTDLLTQKNVAHNCIPSLPTPGYDIYMLCIHNIPFILFFSFKNHKNSVTFLLRLFHASRLNNYNVILLL